MGTHVVPKEPVRLESRWSDMKVQTFNRPCSHTSSFIMQDFGNY